MNMRYIHSYVLLSIPGTYIYMYVRGEWYGVVATNAMNSRPLRHLSSRQLNVVESTRVVDILQSPLYSRPPLGTRVIPQIPVI